jgi:hypothetical protein
MLIVRLHDTTGEPVGDPIIVSPHADGSGYPSLASDGAHFAVAWSRKTTGGSEVLLTVLSEDGPVSEVVIAGGASNARSPDVAWFQGAWTVVWTDDVSGNDDLWIARVGCAE